MDWYGINTESGGTTSGSGVYDSGETVRIIAQPMTGYKFAGWEGAQINEAMIEHHGVGGEDIVGADLVN